MTNQQSNRKEHAMEFKDISTELFRVYTFPCGETVRIDRPIEIAVSDNGHRIKDVIGRGHYVPKGWIHLEWTVAEGKPTFSF